jgi:PleD family two-component response regulator
VVAGRQRWYEVTRRSWPTWSTRTTVGAFATLSIGAAFVPTGTEVTPEALVEKADRAMYEAKRAGRARTVLAAVA